MSKKKADEASKVQHSYHDHANDEEEESNLQSHLVEMSLYRPADQNFPARLHRLLTNAEKEGISHIISWQPHGRCFLVHNKELFEQQVMPRWFQQSSNSSFLRQLNLYGFMRLHKGPDKGGYYHELFLRRKPTLCRKIERTRIKGRGARKAVSHESEPNFYQMTALPPDEPGSGVASAAPAAAQMLAGQGAVNVYPQVASLPIQPRVGQPQSTLLQPQAVLPAQQAAALQLQQMGLWRQHQQHQPAVQVFAPVPALSATTLLPNVNRTNESQSGALAQANANAHQMPTGAPAFDSASISSWSSMALSQHAAGLPGLNAGRPGTASTAASTSATIVQQSTAPRYSLAGNFASASNDQIRVAHGQAVAAETGQSLQMQPNPAQQDILSSATATANTGGTTLPNFLSNLFEPTPFPQLPNFPPTQGDQGQHPQGEQLLSAAIRQQQAIAARAPQPFSSNTSFLGLNQSLAPLQRTLSPMQNIDLQGSQPEEERKDPDRAAPTASRGKPPDEKTPDNI
ncbi:shock factor protein 4 [Seminavis robusta]|uniref:Shock factor protein 4 n=1 Tax=Seminavis robusta TaxID=568900 RepID=A0A9N8EIN3_9STRA|nr:shock factor protein 4 [Seminavis robusta]|eukprot:Sro1195_g251410.1 shock factor protein 4 (514) ;mRNA; r:22537-24334